MLIWAALSCNLLRTSLIFHQINAWIRGLAAPLLDSDKGDVALIEAVPDRSQSDRDGQFVRLVPFSR